MADIKCYDIAEMVLDEAAERFAPQFTEDEEKKRIFRQYCDTLDQLAAEYGGQSFEIEVNETSMAISVTMECGEITIYEKTGRFYQLAERANSVTIRHGEGDSVAIKFVFPPIWSKA